LSPGVDVGDDLRVYRVATDMLSKQSRVAGKGW